MAFGPFEFGATIVPIGGAASVTAALTVAWVLHQAALKPVLQLLAVSVMLPTAVTASLVASCTPWCCAPAVVPCTLAGEW